MVILYVFRPGGGIRTGELTLLNGSCRIGMGVDPRSAGGRSERDLQRTKDMHDVVGKQA